MGGFAAALAAARMGKSVVVVEETDWLGGQLTSQGVPPDEHPWIEQFGCTRSYRRFRESVRACFRDHFPLKGETRVALVFKPGGAMVSRVPCPPEFSLKILQQLMLPYRMNGRIILFLQSRLVAAETDRDLVTSVTVERLGSGSTTMLTGPYFLDATETGRPCLLLEPSTLRARSPGTKPASPTLQRGPIRLTCRPSPAASRWTTWRARITLSTNLIRTSFGGTTGQISGLTSYSPGVPQTHPRRPNPA